MKPLSGIDFRALIEATCAALGQEPPGARLGCGDAFAFEIEMEGVEFVIAHDPGESPDVLSVHARFGRVDDSDAEAMAGILALNLVMAERGSATFGIDLTTMDLVYTCKGRLSGATAQTVLASLRSAANLAANWRNTNFKRTSRYPQSATPEMASLSGLLRV